MPRNIQTIIHDNTVKSKLLNHNTDIYTKDDPCQRNETKDV